MEMKEKVKHKFNFVDAIIILVALLLVAAIAFIFVFDGASMLSKIFDKKESATIYYAVEFTRVKDEFVENNIKMLREGDEVIDAVRNYNIGTYVNSSYNGSEVIGTMKNGGTIVSAYPGYQSVIMVIKAEAEIDDHMYLIDGYSIQVGSSVSVATAEYAGTGYCIALDVVENEEDQNAFWEYVYSLYEEREFVNDGNKADVVGIGKESENEEEAK